MVNFNKKLIDTEELQSKINKMKNEIINSNKNKDFADITLIKTILKMIKSSNEDLNNYYKISEPLDIGWKWNNFFR